MTHTVWKQNFWRIVTSEHIKYYTRLPNHILLAVMVVLLVAFSAAASGLTHALLSTPVEPGSEPLLNDAISISDVALAGVPFAVIVTAAAGTLIGAKEYTTGLAGTTMSTVPKRLPVLWAKIIVFSVWTFVGTTIGVLLALSVANNILGNVEGTTPADWAAGSTWQVVFGVSAFFVGIGLIGLALGMLLRGITIPLITIIGVVLILPTILSGFLGEKWMWLLKILPSNAGGAMQSSTPDPTMLGPVAGGAVFGLWIALAVAGAATALKLRDV